MVVFNFIDITMIVITVISSNHFDNDGNVHGDDKDGDTDDDDGGYDGVTVMTIMMLVIWMMLVTMILTILTLMKTTMTMTMVRAVTILIKIITVYPKKYAHGFVVLCFVVAMQSFIMNSHEVFIHIHHGCFAGTGAIVRLPQCQLSKPGGYGKISQCITTTKHSKAKTVCIFLGIYCIMMTIITTMP